MKNYVLITGASSGIGNEFAKIFAEKGCNLILVARQINKLNELKLDLQKSFGIKVLNLPYDLSKKDSSEKIYSTIKDQNLIVDVLINNAGFGQWGFFHESDWQKQEEMIEVNINSLTHLTRLFVQNMVQRKRGYVLNVASTASFQPGPLMSVYYASKAYVMSFSMALASEVKEKGVVVSCLCPGPTISGFQKAAAIEHTNMVKNRKLPSSYEVALYGYESLMKGKSLAVHGALNKILAFSTRLLPRSMVVNFARKIQESRNQ